MAAVTKRLGFGVTFSTTYEPPFAFTGEVKKVLVDVSGQAVEDKEAELKMYLARQ